MKVIRFALVALLLGMLAACATTGRIDRSRMSFSDQPLIGKFVWHDLMTDDVEAARRFYGGLFGWEFNETRGPRGNSYLLAHADGVYFAGMVAFADAAGGANQSRWLPYVSVDDVDDALTRTTANGGRVAVAARDVDLGRVAAITDPEGAAIGLARSDIGDPDDKTTAAAAGRIVWNELLADDESAAATFYGEVLGLDSRVIDRRGGRYTLLMHGDRNRAGILPNPTEWQSDWLTYFAVDDPAAAAARAESLGGKILLSPSPEVREGSLAIVTDPSGAVLALQKFPL